MNFLSIEKVYRLSMWTILIEYMCSCMSLYAVYIGWISILGYIFLQIHFHMDVARPHMAI